MDYMEFLNKKAEMAKYQQNSASPDEASLENVSPQDVGSLFGEQFSVTQKEDGTSVFNLANQEQLQNLNYEQVMSTEEPTENSALTSILRNFLSFDAVKEDADIDGDGEVSAEEAKDYITKLAAKDGDDETLSMDDFNAVIGEKGIDLASIAEQEMSQLIPPVVTPEKEVPAAPAPQPSTLMTQSVPASGFGLSAVSSSSRGSSAGYSQPVEPANPLDSMTLEQLESEKATRQATLQEKQAAVNAVNDGTNEKVKAAVADKQKAEADYKEAVKNDSNISKSLNKEFSKNLQKINENQAKLDDNAVKINNKEVEISTQEETIKSLSSEIASLTSQSDSFNKQLSRLQDSLSKLGKPTGKPEDAEKDAIINSRKREINAKIAEKNTEITNNKKEIEIKNKELNAANKKLDAFKKDLEKLNTEKTKIEEVKTKLNEEKAAIEEKISKTCSSETKVKMEAYNKAVQNVESVKASELSKAKGELTEAQSAVQEVNAKINEVKNRKVYDGDLNTDNIPDKYKDKISVKTLPNGTQVLTFGYTNYKNIRPEMQEQIALFNEVAAEKGYTFVISDGFRSIAESNAARARKGDMVAPGGSSPHNYGAAFDCGVYKSGGKDLSREEWEAFSAEIKKRSNGAIAWGGDFKTKSYEVWHYELSDWKKYKTA